MSAVRRVVLSGIVLVAALTSRADEPSVPRVDVISTPNGGIQPQAVVDQTGTLHLIYFKGDPGHGDLFYVKQSAGKDDFSAPLRVNSTPATAVAIGSIRGGQLALGRDGFVHIVWNGPFVSQSNPSQLFYSRLKPGATAFDPQRNLMNTSEALDGGGTIAADAKGNVFAAWHGRGAGSPPGEAYRKLWLAISNDDGATFAPEKAAYDEPTGACACCGTKALVDPQGTLHIIYRSARNNGTERDLVLVSSSNSGASFRGADVHPWKINACPMSSMSLVESPAGLLAAWETAGQIYFSHPTRGEKPAAAAGRGVERKHPSLAATPSGLTLLAWAEGTGWQRGGALAWQVYDAAGKPTVAKGRVDRAIPVWSLPAAVARKDGSFVVIH